MIHKFSVVIELEYDDEQGNYVPPSIREVESRIGSALYVTLTHMGFEPTPTHFEVEKGSLDTAFGLGE